MILCLTRLAQYFTRLGRKQAILYMTRCSLDPVITSMSLEGNLTICLCHISVSMALAAPGLPSSVMRGGRIQRHLEKDIEMRRGTGSH